MKGLLGNKPESIYSTRINDEEFWEEVWGADEWTKEITGLDLSTNVNEQIKKEIKSTIFIEQILNPAEADLSRHMGKDIL